MRNFHEITAEEVPMMPQKRHLLDLMTRPENKICADCSAPDPEWASHNLGVEISRISPDVFVRYSFASRAVEHIAAWERTSPK